MNSPNAILHELLNLAEIMLTNGAEVSRVEETLNRMGHAYGAIQMNVFAITSSIIVTMLFPEGEEYTQTHRITTIPVIIVRRTTDSICRIFSL